MPAAPTTPCEAAYEATWAHRFGHAELVAACSSTDAAELEARCARALPSACFERALRVDLEIARAELPRVAYWERACGAGHEESCVTLDMHRIGDAEVSRRTLSGGAEIFAMPEETEAELRAEVQRLLPRIEADEAAARADLAARCAAGHGRACATLGTDEGERRACDLGDLPSCFGIAIELSRQDGRHAEAAAQLESLCRAATGALREAACRGVRALFVRSDELPWDPDAVLARSGGTATLAELLRQRVSERCHTVTQPDERCERALAEAIAGGRRATAAARDEGAAAPPRDAVRGLAHACAARGCSAACEVAGRDALVGALAPGCTAEHDWACIALGRVHEACGTADVRCAAGAYQRACMERDCRAYDPALPSDACARYRALRERLASAPSAPSACPPPPASPCVAISEARTPEEATAALLSIRSQEEVGILEGFPLLWHAAISADGRRAMLPWGGDEDPYVTFVGGPRTRRLFYQPSPPERDEDFESWARDDLVGRTWSPIAALLSEGGFRPTADVPVDGDGLHLVVDREAR
jgi:hypothetical protein